MATRRDIAARGYYDRVHLGVVSAVDATNGTISVLFIDQMAIRDKIPIPVVAMSRDSWIRHIPQVDDIVIIGIRPDNSAVVLGWHVFQYGNRISAFNEQAENAAGIGGKSNLEMCQQLKPGEIDMRSKGGAYLRLNAVGDAMMMSLGGRIHMYGLEGLTENTQIAYKVTDGKSTFRFGAPYRLFPTISEREIPASGQGTPINKPSGLRERDTRLYDDKGNLLVQESLGVVIDESGSVELSGMSGSGVLSTLTDELKKKASEAFPVEGFSSEVANPENLKSLLNINDHVKEFALGFIKNIVNSVSSIITNAQSVFSSLGSLTQFTSIAKTVEDVQGIVTGLGNIADGIDALTGIGEPGNNLRYRLLVNDKDGKQAACYDIDDKGGIVLSSESPTGIALNANKSNIAFYAKKGIRLITKVLALSSKSIGLTSDKDTRLVASKNQIRTAGDSIIDTGDKVTIVGNAEVAVGSAANVRITTVTTTIDITPGNILINGSGTVNINGGGTVNIVGGGTVNISGPGSVIITGATIQLN